MLNFQLIFCSHILLLSYIFRSKSRPLSLHTPKISPFSKKKKRQSESYESRTLPLPPKESAQKPRRDSYYDQSLNPFSEENLESEEKSASDSETFDNRLNESISESADVSNSSRESLGVSKESLSASGGGVPGSQRSLSASGGASQNVSTESGLAEHGSSEERGFKTESNTGTKQEPASPIPPPKPKRLTHFFKFQHVSLC